MRKAAVSLLLTTRPPVGLFASLAASLALFVTNPVIGPMPHLLLAAAFFATVSGGFLINDALDAAKDRINHIDRPVARGDLSPRTALIVGIVFSAIALLLALLLPLKAALLLSATVALLLAYASITRFVGGLFKTLTVAVLAPTPILTGATVGGEILHLLAPAFLVSAITVIRELAFDIADAPGDRMSGIATFAVVHGREAALRLAWAVLGCTLAAVLLLALTSSVLKPLAFAGCAIAALTPLALGLRGFQTKPSPSSYHRFGVQLSHLTLFLTGGAILFGGLRAPRTHGPADPGSLAVLLVGLVLLVAAVSLLDRFNR